jgi:hypothetical protein
MTTEKLVGAGSHGFGDLPGQEISQAVAGKLAGFAAVELSARRYAFGESIALRIDQVPCSYSRNAAGRSGCSRS